MRPDPVGIDLSALDAPPNWDEVFGFHGPLELEIGCGAGGFALSYARAHPKVRYIAFEWRKKYAREVQHKAHQLGLRNLRVLESDAKAQVPRLFAKASLDVIHLQFPDPWWKRAHQKRAILTADFTPTLVELLAPGGVFEVRTDVGDRAEAMLRALESAGLENPLGPGSFHPALPDDFPSSRERRYLLSGQPVYRARLLKRAHPAPAS